MVLLQVLKYTLADVHHVICVSHTSKVRAGVVWGMPRICLDGRGGWHRRKKAPWLLRLLPQQALAARRHPDLEQQP